jgi:hypothetical protein
VPYIDFAALKQRVSIEQAARLLGLTLKQNGTQLRGPCPACGTTDQRALVLTPSKGMFYCHDAKTGGYLFRLVQLR